MSERNIGLDFGTTNSTISYLKNESIEAFQYGGPGGQRYIPSFIAYLGEEEEELEVGSAARASAAYRNDVESYANFKMHLPLAESEFSKWFENNRSPLNVTTDYLREILISSENEYSFQEQEGEISNIVVSVPEIWHRDVNNTGRERLKKIIKEELGFGDRLIQLVSEPVAAAAYYVWQDKHKKDTNEEKIFSGNLLVCDMGGGTFDVSLCKVGQDSSVEVLYFDGQGHQGLECAGVAFDRHCVKAAYFKKHKNYIDESDPKFRTLMRSFESLKIASHNRCTKIINKFIHNPSKFSDKEVYNFDEGYSLTNKEISEVFKPISVGIEDVLGRVTDWLRRNNQRFDRLFLVGGFCQFALVRHAIFSSLSIQENDSRFDKKLNIANSAYAISFGSCVIANGFVDTTEKFVHKMGIEILDSNQTSRGFGINLRFEDKYKDLTLIHGEHALQELSEPIFSEDRLKARQSQFPLTIWVIPQAVGKRYSLKESIELPDYSENAVYRVGMKVDRSLIAYLIIEEINSQTVAEYELGNIFSKISISK
ncbi:molecular chaperone [Leptolyngbya sp. Heron Island J]|uniref:Hsp70 family protein n=1 Tax=Leptolyngbya sp. Heron Island J TaxID=1385935 RepID=UPI0003B95BE4|nr:Hsp70 family protein [Leptolyngbya sp. Heron Island J]ESA32485.1 molecular chaperone [Leptolyngbya sp. Heron Island J]